MSSELTFLFSTSFEVVFQRNSNFRSRPMSVKNQPALFVFVVLSFASLSFANIIIGVNDLSGWGPDAANILKAHGFHYDRKKKIKISIYMLYIEETQQRKMILNTVTRKQTNKQTHTQKKYKKKIFLFSSRN